MEHNKRIIMIRSNSVRPDSRVEKEAESLNRNGFTIKVVAWDRDFTHENHEELLKQDCNIYIVRIGEKASYGEGFKNLNSYVKFQFRMMKYLLQKHNEYDIIHACDFDTAFVSSILSKILKKKFVFDIFDFLYGDPLNLFQKIIKKLQIFIINHADATIICSEDRKNQIANSVPQKLCVIHNSPSPESILFSEKNIQREKTVVVYIGILQDHRLLVEIGDYFKNNPQFIFHIGGFGKYEDYFSQLASKYENIKFFGRTKYEETLLIEKEADIMLAIYDPKLENHRFAAPNKFYEGLMLGKPLIMVRGTGMSYEIEKYDIGTLIDYSIEGLEEGLLTLENRKKDWTEMAKRMKALYDEKYSWAEMERRIVSLYRDL